MHLKSFSIIFLMLILCGCAAKNPVDNKPIITLCGLDVPKKIGNCGKTGQPVPKSEPIPLEKLDKYYAVSDKDYGTWKNYMDKLETYARYMDKKFKQ